MCRKMRNFVPIFEFKQYHNTIPQYIQYRHTIPQYNTNNTNNTIYHNTLIHSSDEEDFLIIRALYSVHEHDGARQYPAMDTGFMQSKQRPD